MARSFYFALLLSTAIVIALLLPRSLEAFSLDTSTHFQNLVACSDTQMVNKCWERHGKSILSSAKPSFSGLAFQFVELCLRQAEAEHLHDLHFLLNVQKCFHLSSTIDLQPFCRPKYSRPNNERIFIAIILVVQIFLFIYMTLGLPKRTILRMQGIFSFVIRALEYSYFAMERFISLFISCISSKSLNFLRKEIMSRVSMDNTLPAVTSKNTMAAKYMEIRSAPCPAPDLVQREKIEMFGLRSKSLFFSGPVVRKNVNVYERKNLDFGCACNVSDYDTHVACRQGSYDSCCSVDNVKENEALSPASEIPEKIDFDGFASVPSHDEDYEHKKYAHKEVHFDPQEVTNSDDAERSDSSSTIEPDHNESQQLTSIKLDHVDSVLMLNLNGKPSFDISTETGRAKMKAYFEKKLGQNESQVSSCKSRENRYLTRVDSRERKMHRVFMAKKGWVWVKKEDASGSTNSVSP